MATADTKAHDANRTPDATKGSVLNDLRELSLTSPVLASRQGWDYLEDLGKTGRRDQLAALFERGQAPEGPHGALEGLIVGNLFGIPEAYLANPLLKIEP